MAASTIKARKTGSTGDPEDCTLSEVLDLIGSAAQGDILYRGASTWARLPAGTSGEYLKTLGAGANPDWDTPAGGGSFPTPLQAVKTDRTTTTSTTFADITGLTQAFTPSTTGQKVLVRGSVTACGTSSKFYMETVPVGSGINSHCFNTHLPCGTNNP